MAHSEPQPRGAEPVAILRHQASTARHGILAPAWFTPGGCSSLLTLTSGAGGSLFADESHRLEVESANNNRRTRGIESSVRPIETDSLPGESDVLTRIGGESRELIEGA